MIEVDWAFGPDVTGKHERQITMLGAVDSVRGRVLSLWSAEIHRSWIVDRLAVVECDIKCVQTDSIIGSRSIVSHCQDSRDSDTMIQRKSGSRRPHEPGLPRTVARRLSSDTRIMHNSRSCRSHVDRLVSPTCQLGINRMQVKASGQTPCTSMRGKDDSVEQVSLGVIH